MISTGNDIVDLDKIDIQRTAQPRFFGKMLVPAEIDMYKAYDVLPFTTYVWLCWSIKEAVFKCHKRNNPDLVFAPRKTIIQQLTIVNNNEDVSVKSIVLSAGVTFYGTSSFYRDAIHSIASASPAQEIQFASARINSADYEQQSAAVRELFLKDAALKHQGNISFDKNSAGCPVVIIDGVESDMRVSFSHHGNYVGYAYCH